MTVESLRWLVTPGCGVAAFLLLYDTHRALRPRIAGEQPWREARALGTATLVVGALVLLRVDGPAWMSGAIGAVLALALVPLLWSSLSLTRLVAVLPVSEELVHREHDYCDPARSTGNT